MTAARPHHVVLLAYPDAQILDVVGPLEIFSRTSRWLRDTWRRADLAYEIEVVGLEAGLVQMSSGLELAARRGFREVEACDTLLVAGGVGWEAAAAEIGRASCRERV